MCTDLSFNVFKTSLETVTLKRELGNRMLARYQITILFIRVIWPRSLIPSSYDARQYIPQHYLSISNAKWQMEPNGPFTGTFGSILYTELFHEMKTERGNPGLWHLTYQSHWHTHTIKSPVQQPNTT